MHRLRSEIMRICPNCEHVDHPYWRHVRWSYWIDFCFFREFEEIQPDLAKHLIPGSVLKDKHFIYRRTSNGAKDVIQRKALIDYGEQWNIPMEHVPHEEIAFNRYAKKLENKKITEF